MFNSIALKQNLLTTSHWTIKTWEAEQSGEGQEKLVDFPHDRRVSSSVETVQKGELSCLHSASPLWLPPCTQRGRAHSNSWRALFLSPDHWCSGYYEASVGPYWGWGFAHRTAGTMTMEDIWCIAPKLGSPLSNNGRIWLPFFMVTLSFQNPHRKQLPALF
jgi:hypothetical protein